MAAQTHPTCDRARSLLATDCAGLADTGDRRALDLHLAACPDCRAYEEVVRRLKSTVALEASLVEPSAGGREVLLAAVRANRAGTSRVGSIGAWWRRLVEFEIPAYQAALGAAAVAVLVFASLPAPLGTSDPAWPPDIQASPVAAALTRADSYRVDQMFRRLDLQQQGPGADTLLSRYLWRQAAGVAPDRAAM